MYNNIIKIYSCILLVIGSILVSYSQNIAGEIKITSDNFPVSSAEVLVKENDQNITTVQTKMNGKATFELNENKNYNIEINKKGYVKQLIDISTQIPESKKLLSSEVYIETELIDNVEGIDYSVLNQPVAKFKFDENSNKIIEDISYKNSLIDKLSSLKKEVEKIQNELYTSDIDMLKEKIKDGDIREAVEKYQEEKEKDTSDLNFIRRKRQEIAEKLAKKKEDKNIKDSILASIEEFKNIEINFNESIQTLKDSLQKFEMKGEIKKVSQTLQNIASTYYENEKYSMAIDNLKKSLKIEKESGNDTTVAELENDIAIAYYDSGKYDMAIEHLENSYEKKKMMNDKTGITNALRDIGTVYENTFQFDKAISFYKKALKISDETKTKQTSAELYNTISDAYLQQSNYDSTLVYIEKSMKIDEESNNEEEVSNSLNNAGVIYYNVNNYEKAIEYYEDAIKINKKLNNQEGVAANLNNIGNINYDWEKYQKALEYYTQSLNIKKDIDFKNGMGISLFNIANTYMKLNNTKKAINNYKASLEIALDIKDQELISKNHRALYKAYYSLNDCKNALAYSELYNKSLYITQIKDDEKEQISEYRVKYGSYEKDLKVAKLKKELKKQKLLAQYEANRRKKEILIKNLEIQRQEEINNKQKIIIFSGVLGLLLIILFSILIYRQYLQKKKANELLIIKNRQIKQQNENITNSISYASRIQQALLPPDSFMDELINDYFVLFKPRDIVSGDFYWVGQQKNKIIVVAADSTGHGVPGAFMSMLGIAFLNEIVNKYDNLKANDLLNELRKLVITSLRQSTEIAHGSKDGMDLALSIIDKDKNEIQFAGAFNPLYLIRNNELIIYKADKMPIAIHRKSEATFTNNIVKIQKNDVLYMFSDGYIDQFGGPDDRKFMGNQFRELLLNINVKSMVEQKEILDNTILNWIGDGSQLDDILVFGIRI